MAADCDAPTARAQDALFVSQCSLQGLADHTASALAHATRHPALAQTRLPLPLPLPRLAGSAATPATWEHLSDFDLALRLIDFSGLRPVLAQRLGWTTRPRPHTLRPCLPLPAPRLADHQRLEPQPRPCATCATPATPTMPSASASRTASSPPKAACATSSPPSAHTPRPPAHVVTIPLDDERTVDVAVRVSQPPHRRLGHPDPPGRHHEPRGLAQGSRLSRWHAPRCRLPHALCLRPGLLLPAARPQTTHTAPARPKRRTRPIAAVPVTPWPAPRSASMPHPGIPRPAWSSTAAPIAPQTVPISPPPHHPTRKKRANSRYGYRSLPLQLADAQRRTSFVLLDHVSSPLPSERKTPPLPCCARSPPSIPPCTWTPPPVTPAWAMTPICAPPTSLGIKRVVDLRADATDKNTDTWVMRGYDDKGRPALPLWLCPSQQWLRTVSASATSGSAPRPVSPQRSPG